MSKERLNAIADDIILLMEKGMNNLKEIPPDKFGLNEIRCLEIFNKIASVCMTRTGDKKPGKYDKFTDEELESSF